MEDEPITDEDYKKQIKEIDSNISSMLILMSLVAGFLITNLINIYINSMSISIF